MRILIPVLFLFCLGCQTTPADKMAFRALQADFAKIAPEYVEHVTKCVQWADPVQRDQRLALVKDMQRLLEEKAK